MKHSEVLSRYVNTGEEIPEEQYERLTPMLKNTYMRRRGVIGYRDWEYKLLNNNQRINFIKNKGEELNFLQIYKLLNYSENKDIIATKIIDVKGNKLSVDEVRCLITKDYFNKYDIAIKIIETFGEKLDSQNLKTIILFSNNKDTSIKIIDTKGKELNYNDIENLLIYLSFRERFEIATKIIKTKGKELNDDDLYFLFKSLPFNFYPERKELIKKTLLENGVDYNLINNVINKYNTESEEQIPLIPDNYKEMLQEIKRIKQIML
jgi:hypothetical protein